MFGPRLQALLDQAAQPAIRRIRHDRERIQEVRISRVLTHMELHLYQIQTREQLLRDLEIRDRNVATVFAAKTGEPLMEYVRNRRLETAVRLLTSAEPNIAQISELVGFASNKTFAGAFKRWSETSPKKFRKMAFEVRRAASAKQPRINLEILDSILDGKISQKARHILLLWLGETQPYLKAVVSSDPGQEIPEIPTRPLKVAKHDDFQLPSDLLDAATETELPKVRKLWKRLAELSIEEQHRKLCRHYGEFRTPALFYWLREASRIAARTDRRRGLELAELGLFSARLIELGEKEELRSGLHALAWIWLGNQRRLQLDFPGAEKAFENAEIILPEEECNPYISGDFYFYKSYLLWYQRHFKEALSHVERAIPLFERAASERSSVEALIFRETLHHVLGEYDIATIGLEAILKRIARSEFPFQWMSAHHLLIRCYLDKDDVQRAASGVKSFRAQARSYGWGIQVMTTWLEGLVALGLNDLDKAEEKLVQARIEFLLNERSEHAACTSLDLAFTYACMGQLDKAAYAAAEAIPVFRRLKLIDKRQSLRTVRILRDAAEEKLIQCAVVGEIRNNLRTLMKLNPSFGLDCQSRHLGVGMPITNSESKSSKRS